MINDQKEPLQCQHFTILNMKYVHMHINLAYANILKTPKLQYFLSHDSWLVNVYQEESP